MGEPVTKARSNGTAISATYFRSWCPGRNANITTPLLVPMLCFLAWRTVAEGDLLKRQ